MTAKEIVAFLLYIYVPIVAILKGYLGYRCHAERSPRKLARIRN